MTTNSVTIRTKETSEGRNCNPFRTESISINGTINAGFPFVGGRSNIATLPEWDHRRFSIPDRGGDDDLHQRVVRALQNRLGNQVRDFQLTTLLDGLILRGEVRSYYGKQMTQEIVMEVTGLSILANDIEVRISDITNQML